MSVTRPDSTGAALKASLDAAREELRAAIARGAGGRGALERYADRVDAMIRQLFTDAGPYDGPIAIVALGGYGRRHLCLHSDIDLLLLFGGGIGPAEERFVHRFLNPLWDLGVVVGHQVRDIEDFQQLETDNPEFLLALLGRRPVPTVLDADALALFRGPVERPVVFTPHLGEFRSLVGDQLADQAANDRWAAATKAAQKLRGTVLLKGVPTVIADLRGPVHVVASGNPGLATGGSGDLLAGFTGAFLARGSAPPEAAALGAHALGRAAEHGARQWTARSLRPADVLAALPDIWRAWADSKPAGPPVLAVLESPETE